MNLSGYQTESVTDVTSEKLLMTALLGLSP